MFAQPGRLFGFFDYWFAHRRLGPELVTDGTFSEYSATNVDTSDFSGGVDGWSGFNGSVAAPITVGGEDNALRFTFDATDDEHCPRKQLLQKNKVYRVRESSYLPSGQTTDGMNWVAMAVSSGASHYGTKTTDTDTWVSTDRYWRTSSNPYYYLALWGFDGTDYSYASDGDLLYAKDIILDNITLDNWTEGVGWTKNVSDGALEDGAKSISTAGSSGQKLYQAVTITRGRTYRLTFDITGHVSGTITPQLGGTSGTGVSADGSYAEDIVAGDSDSNLAFVKSEYGWAVINNVSLKEYTG